jgi:hypothetical protein
MEMAAASGGLEDLAGGALLDHVADLAALQRRCEVQILAAAVQHAYLNDEHALDHATSHVLDHATSHVLDHAGPSTPGRERARQLGGAGTPVVAEFAAAELAGRLGCSTVSAGLLMADGLDLCHRLPGLWRRVQEGQVRVYLARLVARRTRELSPEQAGYVDERVSEYADGRLTYTRFERLLEGAVAAADVEAARLREQRAAKAQWARPTRPEEGESDHGMRGFTVRAPFSVVAVLDAAVQRIADILAHLGDADPVDQRRVKALLVLARPDVAAQLIADYTAWADRPKDPIDPHQGSGQKPEVTWQRLLPRVIVNVHTFAAPDADEVARVERCGAMSAAWVRDHLTRAARVTVRPVLDIEGQAPVDAYEIPERHRQAVRLMTPADTFPFSSSLRPQQIDHTVPYLHGVAAVGSGQSRVGNYGPLRTFHHRIKTFGRWTVKQPFPGIYLWRDPHGELYLVDHTGTRRLAQAA